MNAEVMILKAKLRNEGEVKVHLSGKCMQPLLFQGDSVIIIPVEKLALGDLYLLELPNGTMVLHRLISIQAGCCVFKGDRARRAEIINYNQVIGRAKGLVIENKTEIFRRGFVRRLQTFLSEQSTLFTEIYCEKIIDDLVVNRQKSTLTELCNRCLIWLNTIVRRRKSVDCSLGGS